MMNLTEKEQTLLSAIAKGMDEPGCGWLGEIAFNLFNRNHYVIDGILGSLVKKGLVDTMIDESGLPGVPDAVWVSLTDEGEMLK